jgi:L-arabinose transport system substrate-binding protein
MRLSKWIVGGMVVAVCGAFLAGCGRKESASGPEKVAKPTKIKLGYLVKQPEEPWFQVEWQFAEKAAQELGFDLVKLAVPDAEKTLSAIDNLAAQGAKGFVICTPDVRLGPAIVAKADSAGLKFMTVDDQFLGPDGTIMTNVHHLGVAARKVGNVSGQSLWDAFKQRGWPLEETAACIVTFDELDTAHQRTEGIIEKLIENGFPKERIFKTPQKTTDIPGSFDAANILLTQHAKVKYWLAAGMNDSATLGAVRALEGRGFTDKTAVAIGINGTDCIDEFKKASPTPFYGSILMEANVHGHDTAAALYAWVAAGTEPAMARFTGGLLITRETFEQKLKERGMWR